MAGHITPRRIVLAYGVAGLLLGTAFTVWQLGDKLNAYYLHPDGSLSTAAVLTEKAVDPLTDATYTTHTTTGRKLNLVEKAFVGTRDSLGIPLVAALVGACWGFVHLKAREWIADPFGDANKLDYEELSDRICPHGMT